MPLCFLERVMVIKMKEPIRSIVKSLGADVCGIASIERFKDAPSGFAPTDIYKDCKSVIAFGVALPKGTLEINPRLVYSHFNGDVMFARVDGIALLAAKQLEETFDLHAVPLPCDAPNEYWDAENLTAKGLISMKHTAMMCGIGQLGKNTLLMNPTYGNRLCIGAILLNIALESDPVCENLCLPNCHLCEEHCPVRAIEQGKVNQKLCRQNTYGKTARGFDTVDCNICRTICPMKFGKNKDVQ